ncbi:MAG TPA: LON peptidase substrate-binding domain-containing protein [Kofleriaceae bacterium]|nr:LON peptidase substrate-binding domain-containing protein [Kofleriaceae bacterium]
MSRPLPPRPHLDHLKAQAKDLLDAHRRGEIDAFRRIRASVPAFARMSDDELARATFALHDAQSAIAREYGFVSWAELRDKVAALNAAPPEAAPEAGDPDSIARFAASRGLSPESVAALREAIVRRRSGADAPTPAIVPVIPLRNAVAFPGAVIPIDVQRAPTLRAIDAAVATEHRFLAIFAQRAPETERPVQEDLHTTGCLCTVLHLDRREAGNTSHVIIGGVRWVTLDAIEHMDPYYAARVSEAGVERGDDQEIVALDHRLRTTARRYADTLPAIREQAIALIDGTQDIGQLADLAMSVLPVPVDESAAYARESQLVRRLERVIAALDAELAKASAAAPPA